MIKREGLKSKVGERFFSHVHIALGELGNKVFAGEK
jgi:hypothetical protein